MNNNDLFALCICGAGAGLFLACFLMAFEPLAVKLLGAGILLGVAVFAAAAVKFHERKRP